MVVDGVQLRGRRGLAERIDAGTGWLMMTVLTDNTIHWSVNDQWSFYRSAGLAPGSWLEPNIT